VVDALMPECFPVEEIPDEDYLFMAIKRKFIADDGTWTTAAFRNGGVGEARGMSTDWEKYSTAEQTQCRIGPSELHGVLRMSVRAIREIPIYKVAHDPRCDNQAHTNVTGPKSGDEKTDQIDRMTIQLARQRLMALAEWEIPADPLP
jgi:hypothetical protein